MTEIEKETGMTDAEYFTKALSLLTVFIPNSSLLIPNFFALA